jgi:hypothetical protein
MKGQRLSIFDNIKTALFLIVLTFGIILIAPFVVLALCLLAAVEAIQEYRWKRKLRHAKVNGR